MVHSSAHVEKSNRLRDLALVSTAAGIAAAGTLFFTQTIPAVDFLSISLLPLGVIIGLSTAASP